MQAIYAGTSIGILGAYSSDGMLILNHAHSEAYRLPEGSGDLGITLMTTNRELVINGSVALLQRPRVNSDLSGGGNLSIPFWLLIVISGGVGFLLIVRRPLRFRLRALAIAATAIVLTLGLGVAASRLPLG